jgi:hypothetical protein
VPVGPEGEVGLDFLLPQETKESANPPINKTLNNPIQNFLMAKLLFMMNCLFSFIKKNKRQTRFKAFLNPT